ncbi:hypothetical protein EP47_03570 [Legionella norrlandica]|uniref:Aminotransferase DegT n=1 Tax=Legionella norrlandica TaxID=1498499 RepID=A0A0A2STC8_9GAMM|nr:aminotransferase class I/II-fold pyridoxal phosphate-dependent enzyme [Legionella norrlandica]KGP64012.1 hypothetical protein EP47_03570 [Legionella norrlandica]
MLSVFKPRLPLTSDLIPYLEKIDSNRWYSNFGPLHEEFRQKLAIHFGLGIDQVALASNATVGLALTLEAVSLKRPSKQCICPSWTFAATPHAIIQAGMSPVFLDVDENSWDLNSEQLDEKDFAESSAITVVSPFGQPVNLTKWEKFVERYGVPVVCDAAASFDAVGKLPTFNIGSIPIVISLHATKTLPAGEGAIILCSDPDLIERIRQMSNFGFSTTSVAQTIGTNAKLSEYACAVGLASLQNWQQTRDILLKKTKFYRAGLKNIPSVEVFGSNTNFVANYLIIETKQDSYQLSNFLRERKIDTRRWWRSGCHNHPAFSSYNVKPLPITKRLASHSLGLPFFLDITEEDIESVINAVAEFSYKNNLLSDNLKNTYSVDI